MCIDIYLYCILNEKQVIGILDIFGFEAFKHNSFEQVTLSNSSYKHTHTHVHTYINA